MKDEEMKDKNRREEGGKGSALYLEPSQPRPSPTPAGLDTPDKPTAVVTRKCCMLHPASSDKTAQPSWLGRRDLTSGFSCFLRDNQVGLARPTSQMTLSQLLWKAEGNLASHQPPQAERGEPVVLGYSTLPLPSTFKLSSGKQPTAFSSGPAGSREGT